MLNRDDSEVNKFRVKDNKTAVAVTADEPIPVSSSGVLWDSMITTFPSPTEELYSYSYKGDLVLTAHVTYDSTAKGTILSLVKTRYVNGLAV